MRILALFLAASMLALSTGCATVLKGKYETINVMSDPSGARVTVNGSSVGVTPISVRVDGTRDVSLLISKDGYSTSNTYVTSSVGAGWVILGLFTFPFSIVDLATGDWKSLDQSNVGVVLDKR